MQSCGTFQAVLRQQVMVNWHNLRTAQPTSAAAAAMAAYSALSRTRPAEQTTKSRSSPLPSPLLSLPLPLLVSPSSGDTNCCKHLGRQAGKKLELSRQLKAAKSKKQDELGAARCAGAWKGR